MNKYVAITMSVFALFFSFSTVALAGCDKDDPSSVCKDTCGDDELVSESATADCPNDKPLCCGKFEKLEKEKEAKFQAAEKAAAGPAIKGFPDPLGGKANIQTIVKNLISAALFVAGAIFFVMFLWGGVTWLTAGGDAQKVTKARTRLVNAVIGLIILMASYGITFTIIEKLAGAQQKSQGQKN